MDKNICADNLGSVKSMQEMILGIGIGIAVGVGVGWFGAKAKMYKNPSAMIDEILEYSNKIWDKAQEIDKASIERAIELMKEKIESWLKS